MTQVLSEPVDALLPLIKQASSLHLDETGHRKQGQSAWMWVVASATAAYFSIVKSRGKRALAGLMADSQAIAVTDRYSVYNYFESTQRQLCWAHLKWDFTRLAQKREPVIARIGKALLEDENELFTLWHIFKKGYMTRNELQEHCKPLQKRIGENLEKCSYTDPHLRVDRFAKNLLKHFYALWTFLSVEQIEPTNNHAERCLRPWVIWRKKYFGTRSEEGTDYVARTASWLMSCQLQSKNAFDYLQLAVSNHFYQLPPPPLIESPAN